MSQELTGKSLAELRQATVAQIRTAAKARLDGLSKAQLIRLEMHLKGFDPDRAVKIHDSPVKTYREDQQIESQLDVERDALGTKTGSRLVTHTYYDSGEIDTITISERDANDVETARKTIKHHRDGRQPEVV